MDTTSAEKVFSDLGKISFQELQSTDFVNTLDPNGWAIRSPGENTERLAKWVSLADENGNTVAAIMVAPAEKSQFQRLTNIMKKDLETAIYIGSIWVAPRAQSANILPAILYMGLRRGRIWGRQSVVALIPVPNIEAPIATLLHLDPIDKLDTVEFDNKKYLPAAQQLKYAIHHAYNLCHDKASRLLKNHFIDEVLETHALWVDRFFKGSWAKSITKNTMTKEQYVISLYNLHEYVRQTTRLCARCIAHSEDLTIRNHYIYHLKGEINHEIMIERDLKHLGADVEYLTKYHVPHPATKEFMVVQESTIGFYQDPILMLACPLAAEGVAGKVRPEFLEALYKTIGSWGTKEPKEAARFFSSHVNTDGGEDGHWAHVVKMLHVYINTEHDLQKFLSVLAGAMNGFEKGFNANIEDYKLWEANLSSREKS